VLLVSEDLDELLELADRIAVIAEGRLVYETPAETASRAVLGRHMAGHSDGPAHGPSASEPLQEMDI
jgi:ABC-type sugar transport system ATPase subunit